LVPGAHLKHGIFKVYVFKGKVTLRKISLVGVLCLAAVGSWAAESRFSPESYLRHVKYLAADELQGRGNGTPGLDKAAEYIAAEFRASGLQPGGDGETFFQKFALTTGSRIGPGNRLTFNTGQKELEGKLRTDFVPVGIGEKNSVAGEMVFAGYGITADEYNYDDYKGFDVTDKVVMVLSGEPREGDPHSPFNGQNPTMHGEDNSKAMNAKYRGARAILIVHGDGRELPEVGETQVDELGICTLKITRSLAQRVLASQGRDIAALQKEIDAALASKTFAMTETRAGVELDVERVRKDVRNVVGLLPGSDPSVEAETVILGAHYDHLGHGGRNSMSTALIGQIHNGADDNASGTSALLELAAALARDPAPRRRAYLFIAFAGEELGLHGSAYWAANPSRGLSGVTAMLNMDMVGRLNNNQVLLGGIGTSPVFPEIVKAAAAEQGLEIRTTQSGYGSSDHTSFYVKDIPVLFFFSGLHGDYHRPSDDWDKINAEGAAKIVGMVHSIAKQLNSMDKRPQFTKVTEPIVTGTSGQSRGPGYGSYFGSVPDMTGDVKGVRFSDVRPNSPAAKAGLRGNDVLVKFAGKEVAGLQDFTYLLRSHKPGETVEVVVLRDGKPLTVQVTLEVRR
jgi:hypothetical protein